MRKYSTTTWNIGFLQYTESELIKKRRLGKIRWLKHSFKDRFFADPFILNVSKNFVSILVEEFEFEVKRGRIVELIVDLDNCKLVERKVLLDLDTHLSYPAIFRINGRVYVYPENGESNKLTLYEYDYKKRILLPVKTIINEGLIDATIFKSGDKLYLIATKNPYTQQDAFLYSSTDIKGTFVEIGRISKGKKCSRSAGNIFMVDAHIYRPAQNCCKIYGGNMEIMRIENFENYKESHMFSLTPSSFRYNLGLHTINFFCDICVVDGKGYLYPILGRLYSFLQFIYHCFR